MSNKSTEISNWALDKIYNALRLTSNINNCSSKKTAYDRIVTEALELVRDIVIEQGIYVANQNGVLQKDYSKL